MARSASTYRTELQHVLDASGNLVPLPQAAERLGRQLCGIVAWVTRLQCSEFDSTNVICQNKRCSGVIEALLQAQEATIQWQCPECGDNGAITGWQQTVWDRR
jgi:hypothetical protein